MLATTKSELKMLRELTLHFSEGQVCFFCKKVLIERDSELTYGHRRHGPILERIAIHHIDEMRDHNRKENRAPCHSSCHRSHHARQQAARRLNAGTAIDASPF